MKKFLQNFIGFAKIVMGADGWTDVMVGALVMAAFGWVRPIGLGMCLAYLLCLVYELWRDYSRCFSGEGVVEPWYACFVRYALGVVAGLAIVGLNCIR